MNIISIERGLKKYILKYQADLSPNKLDLIDEIVNKLKAIQLRDKEIYRLVKELHNNPKDIFFIDEESGRIFINGNPTNISIKRKDANNAIKVSGRSEGWPIAYRGGMKKHKIKLEEDTIKNYEDMHRIYNICKELQELNQFKPKGVLVTRNQLLVHAREKSGITFDSFAVDSVTGPRIKGFRKDSQKNILPNAGYYYKDCEEFMEELDSILSQAIL